MNDTEISEWCKETKLTDYICINEIKEMDIDKFIDKYGQEWNINTFYNLTIDELNERFEKIGKTNITQEK